MSDLSIPLVEDPLRVSVLISDASRMRCELLAAKLLNRERLFRVVGRAVSLSELLEQGQTNPHVTVISSQLREGALAGFEALAHLRTSPTRAIMLLDRCDRELVVSAFRGGARGVFCRTGSLDEFIKCIERVNEGQVWAGNAELGFILETLTTLAPLRLAQTQQGLNRREDQIAALVVAGSNNREIGRKLNLTEKAVAEGLMRLCNKLGVKGRVELAMAVRQGSPPPV